MKQINERGIFFPLLAVSFITLRLCSVILWPWVWVLCPIWGPYALIFFIALWHAIRKEERRKHAAKEELKTAGPHHRRDLLKHIHRMQKELLIYDRYQQAARISRERATAPAR